MFLRYVLYQPQYKFMLTQFQVFMPACPVSEKAQGDAVFSVIMRQPGTLYRQLFQIPA